MQFLQEQFSSPPIQSYDAGVIKIQDTLYHHSMIITPTIIQSQWRPAALSELTQQDIQQILDLHPDVVLLGTGATLTFPPPTLYAWIKSLPSGLEIMDTAAACRTYNVLLAEGRQVAAGLILSP